MNKTNIVFATDSATRSFIVFFTDANYGMFRDVSGYVGLFAMTIGDEIDAKVNATTLLCGTRRNLRQANRKQVNTLVQQLKRKQLCEVLGERVVAILKVIDS